MSRRPAIPTRAVAALATVGAVLALTCAVDGPAAAAPAAAAPAAAVRTTLASGQTLASGKALQDVGSGQTLTMQTDGNLVLRYTPAGRVLFATRTAVAGSRLVNQTDGNVVVRDPAGRALWASGARPAGDLRILTCGALFQTTAVTSCATGSTRNALFAASTSPDGRTSATLQTDGNLVLRTTAGGFGSRVLWASNTRGAITAVAQGDGNLVLRDSAGTAVWTSGTGGRACATCSTNLAAQDDGNLVLRASNGVALWSTGTTAATWADRRLTMTARSLGGVRVGMTLAQARAAAVVPVQGTSAPSCPVYSTTGATPRRLFQIDPRTGRVDWLMVGNSDPIVDVTDSGITATSTAAAILARYGSGARSYTDIYGSFVILVRFADGNEFRFDFFNGRGGSLSMIQAGAASVVERTEICG